MRYHTIFLGLLVEELQSWLVGRLKAIVDNDVQELGRAGESWRG